jgi:hypothetical protein
VAAYHAIFLMFVRRFPVAAKVRGLLEGIQDMTDDTRQLISLTELCEMLSMGTEDTLQGVVRVAIGGPRWCS